MWWRKAMMEAGSQVQDIFEQLSILLTLKYLANTMYKMNVESQNWTSQDI